MTLPSIFNCSNDMALAANVRQYFPPKRIVQMEDELSELAKQWEGTRFAGPWGWSLATKQRYKNMGVPPEELPSDEWLSEVRKLSSREYACSYIHDLLAHFDDSRLLGKEMAFATDAETVARQIDDRRGERGMENDACNELIFKSPWSSSGRGVFTSHGLDRKHIMQKLQGFMNTQGGFVVDRFHECKTLDFAMEFFVNADHSVDFLGYSVFHAAENGAYGYNMVESQEELKKRIGLDDSLLNALIDYHRKHLGATSYHGPVGIDMIKTSDGSIHPVIEINLRMNMGILALILQQKYDEARTSDGGESDMLRYLPLTEERARGFQAKIEDRKLMIVFNR